MVFLTDLNSGEYVFTYGVFGVQYETLTAEKKKQIATLYSLLSQSADRVDHLQTQNHGFPSVGPSSSTFIAYWISSEEYEKWKETSSWKEFWSGLPDDAGVWREVMTVPKSRFMHASSQEVGSGMSSLLKLKQSSDEGYWGVYRHRLSETPDEHTAPDDTFTSPYVTSANTGSDRPVIDIPKGVGSSIRLGRVTPSIPNNLCFVREGQRQPHCPKEEIDAWVESINPHAQAWITHLNEERNRTGVVSLTTHLGYENPSLEPLTDPFADVEEERIPETNQLAYFLDLAHFELAGRSHRGHVQLRKNAMELYGPGGKLSTMGKAVLYVELCVLKSGDMDAEYIGCMEGTGLMYLNDIS
ncbi:heme-containing dehydratase protein [Tricladium varicosporioides]|nr:heme-containing dehydratase protein [Hymenoscyphus varicosporioides]